MKKISKLFAVAIAVTALASCSSDDLNLGQQIPAGQGKLVATIGESDATRTAAIDQYTETGEWAGAAAVFSNDDQIRVFTLDALKYHNYKLVEGAGSTEGTFTSTSPIALPDAKKYAATDSRLVYSISSTEDAEALLTMSIPYSYPVDLELMGEGVYKMPAPYWGEVTKEEKVGDNYDLTVKLQPLVSYLRVDLKNLPINTKAIVLTTHGDDGYQLARNLPLNGDEWIAPSADATPASALNPNDWSDVPFTTGGASEAISGTFNAVLKDGAKLDVDPGLQSTDFNLPGSRLVTSDTLRIDLAEIMSILFVDERGNQTNVVYNGDQVFYVPIIAREYENLRVIAVTGDSKFSYCWAGEEIANFKGKEFYLGKAYPLSLNTLDIPAFVTPSQLSQILWEADGGTKANPAVDRWYTSLANVENLVVIPGVDDIIYIEDERERNSVVLNIKNIIVPEEREPYVEELQSRQAVPVNSFDVNQYTLKIEEATRDLVEGWESISLTPIYTWKAKVLGWGTVSSPYERTLTVNVPSNFAQQLEFNTPSSNVVLGTVDNLNGAAQVKIQASDTKFVAGRNVKANNSVEVQNYKDAAIKVRTGFASLEVAKGNTGDVYIYTGGQEETYITDNLTVSTQAPISVRISDALVENINWMPSYNQARYLYTDGTAAFKTLNVHPDASGQNPNLNNVEVFGYWTGKALTEFAINNGFDQHDIWTTAQLASVGENTTNSYIIYKDDIKSVSELWLGGSEYPWIGAQVTVNNFQFDGKEVSLQNMELDTNDPTFKDPHNCCTSCGPERKITVTENLGLFRSIINEDKATVKNINLNDVMIDTDARIDHIGSIVGLVWSPNVHFDYNYIGEVKIKANGYGIGGMIGRTINTKLFHAATNRVYGLSTNANGELDNKKRSGWIESKLANVGGLVGFAQTGLAEINSNIVYLRYDIKSDEANVGGISGYLVTSTEGGASGLANITGNTVKVLDFISADQLSHQLYLEKENVWKQYFSKFAYFDQIPYEFIDDVNDALNEQELRGELEDIWYPQVYALASRYDWVVAPTVGTFTWANVGGISGMVKAAGKVLMLRNVVEVTNYITGRGNFVGGIAGQIDGEEEVWVAGLTYKDGAVDYSASNVQTNNGALCDETGAQKVTTKLLESTENGFVGGLVGYEDAQNATKTVKNIVNIDDILASGGAYASGGIGFLQQYNDDAEINLNSVNVKNKIYAKWVDAAGLVGFNNVVGTGAKTLMDRQNQVNAGLIKSEDGYAGGFIATANNGTVYIGQKECSYDKNKSSDDVSKVIAKIETAYNAGGMIGDNQVPVYVYSYERGNHNIHQSGKHQSRFEINVTFANSKAGEVTDKGYPSNFFSTPSDLYKFGTFGNILGHMNAKFDWYKMNYAITDNLADNPSGKNLVKGALFFPYHPDRGHTWNNVEEFNNLLQWYWGDNNENALGWGDSGEYYINGKVVRTADQIDMSGYNIFKKYTWK
jgi:hypothetical protein